MNRSENRSRSENQSNRYSWMMGIMRRLNEKGTTLALNILNSDSWGDNESFSLSKTTYFRLEDKLGNDSVLFRNQYLKSPQKIIHGESGLPLPSLLVRRCISG